MDQVLPQSPSSSKAEAHCRPCNGRESADNRAAEAAAGVAAARATTCARAAGARAYEMLEEYSGQYFDWAVQLLAWARQAREERLEQLAAAAAVRRE